MKLNFKLFKSKKEKLLSKNDYNKEADNSFINKSIKTYSPAPPIHPAEKLIEPQKNTNPITHQTSEIEQNTTNKKTTTTITKEGKKQKSENKENRQELKKTSSQSLESKEDVPTLSQTISNKEPILQEKIDTLIKKEQIKTPISADDHNIQSKDKIKKTGSFFGTQRKNQVEKTAKELDEEQDKTDKLLRDASKKKMRSKFDQKKNKEKRILTKILDAALEKSGYELKGQAYNKTLKKASIISGFIITAILLVVFEIMSYKIPVFFVFTILTLPSMIALSYILLLIGSFIFFDYKSYQRTKEIEEVLPEFLQLASANISAGMPIDRALWFAVRPKFGVLAKEIEEVAKATMAGEDLEEALEAFTKKYDSRSLKEAMHLLIEGMRAGGEIGFLLNQIASNMQDIKLMRKEIAASIMSYVIFITAAAVVGAPALLALSSQLLVIMGQISSSVQLDDSSSTFKLDMSGDSIDVGDFKIFAVVVIIISSVFSAMIISVIRKGNTTESLKSIPGFILVALLIFFTANALLGSVLGGFFA